MKSTSYFYNKIALLYPAIDLFLNRFKRDLVSIVNLLPPGRLLEIGVGSGHYIDKYKGHDIMAIDTSTAILNKAKTHISSHIDLQLMDAQELKFKDNTFDYIILSHTLSVVDNSERVLSECHRVLKRGGRLIILNHFTPNNALRFLDYIVHRFARIFHFKAIFKIDHLKNLHLFEISCLKVYLFSYFKIINCLKK